MNVKCSVCGGVVGTVDLYHVYDKDGVEVCLCGKCLDVRGRKELGNKVIDDSLLNKLEATAKVVKMFLV